MHSCNKTDISFYFKGGKHNFWTWIRYNRVETGCETSLQDLVNRLPVFSESHHLAKNSCLDAEIFDI